MAEIQNWNSFAQMAAGASAQLLGLLFVAVSLNRDRIMKYPSLGARAIETLLMFMLPLLVSILLVIPHQTLRLLGIELLVLAAIRLAALFFTGRRTIPATFTARKEPDHVIRLDRLLSYTSPAFITTLLVLIAGVAIVTGHVGGLYWLAAAIVLSLVGGVWSAWLFLVVNPADQSPNVFQ